MKHVIHPFENPQILPLDGPIVATEPVVYNVLIEELDNGDLIRRSDIHLILHQEKLAQLGERVSAAFLDSMQPAEHPSMMPDGVSDSQIIASIKSKYIQNPSELSAWMEHIRDLAISEVDKTQALTNSNCTVESTSSTVSDANKVE